MHPDGVKLAIYNTRQQVLKLLDQVCLLEKLVTGEAPVATRRHASLVLEETAEECGIHYFDILSPYRGQYVCVGREIAAWILYTRMKLPLKAIGLELGGRHHSTIIHAIKRVEADPGMKQRANRIYHKVIEKIEEESTSRQGGDVSTGDSLLRHKA